MRKNKLQTNTDGRRFINLNIQRFSEVYPEKGLTESPQSMQRSQSSAIPVTSYEKSAASRFRTRIARIFTDPCASVSSAQSVFYLNPTAFISLYLKTFDFRSNYS